jgi:hypothetical protein
VLPHTTAHLIINFYFLICCRSSGSIVSDYGLDDRAIGVRSPAEAKDFSSNLCVQTGSGAHPASCTMGTEGPFPGGKARPGRDADHSPPSSAEDVNELELYLLSPKRHHGVKRDCFFWLFICCNLTTFLCFIIAFTFRFLFRNAVQGQYYKQ